MSTHSSSAARVAANQENATHSTGPKTEEGERISSHNALKTGLTGRTVLLPTDDVPVYVAHRERIHASHKPATEEEIMLVDSIVDLEWRLLRIPTLETGIFAIGHKRLAAQFEQDPAERRATMLESEIFLTYQKELKNLHLQENRLVRRLEKQLATLAALQHKREAEEQARLAEAVAYYRDCLEHNKPYDHSILAEIGFEFSILDLQRAAATRQARETRSNWPRIQAEQTVKTLGATQAA